MEPKEEETIRLRNESLGTSFFPL